jgi:hypothetical protein
MHSEINRRQVIALARSGVDDARLTLRDLIGEFEQRDISLPAELTKFSCSAPRPRRRGEKFQKRFVRNLSAAVIACRWR